MAEPGTTTARPYAQAVFEIARADNQLSAWSDFLRLAAEIATSPDADRYLAAPGADRFAMADGIAAIAGERLGNTPLLNGGEGSVGSGFLKVLAENQRLGVLPQILVRYEALKAEAEGSLDVVLTSSSEVSAAQQQRITESLKKRFGRDVRLSVQVDAALIGGARLQIGDRVIDGSVRTELDKLAIALRA
ncbi:MAG: F0F1 ATP synthase subunit delta [Gammaproteobacteria bacterium PRO9]|nr:F0F1 ATP synthase subunit delta [Gammaproteobacteria bacterium PRO9]